MGVFIVSYQAVKSSCGADGLAWDSHSPTRYLDYRMVVKGSRADGAYDGTAHSIPFSGYTSSECRQGGLSS